MRFSSTSSGSNPLLLPSLLLLTLLPSLAQASSSSSSGQDLFAVKSSPIYSKFWSVEYFDTYKIAKNLASNSSYLLYQNGTQPPSSELNNRHDAVVSIPVQKNVGLTEITSIPFLELLDVQNRVLAYLGNKALIASPCFLQLISDGSIIDFSGNASNASALNKAGINAATIVTFATIYDSIDAISNKILISTFSETTNEGIYEWIKFYALFFNLEETANRLSNETFARASCVKENAASVTTDNPKLPVVLWAYYSTYAGGWSIASCPNYYCDFASACSATLLPFVNGSISKYETTFLNDTEFLQFGATADVWIFPSPDWTNIYSSKQDILNQFKSVQNQKVFDYQGSGENAWFEERYAEYDVVIQDFCSVVGKYVPSPTIHHRIWFRNVFTEPEGNLDQCSDPGAPLQSRATECVPTTKTSDAASSQRGGIMLWLTTVVVVVVMTAIMGVSGL